MIRRAHERWAGRTSPAGLGAPGPDAVAGADQRAQPMASSWLGLRPKSRKTSLVRSTVPVERDLGPPEVAFFSSVAGSVVDGAGTSRGGEYADFSGSAGWQPMDP